VAFKPQDIMRPEAIAINIPVLVFAVLTGVAATVLFGLTPALAASRTNINTAIQTGGAGGASAARLRSRQFLIAFEVALALVLVTGAGLMIRSFQELLAVGVGFRTSNVSIADIELPAARYRDDAARSRFFHSLAAGGAAVPGVVTAAIVDNPPLHRISMSNFYIEGRPDPPVAELPIADKVHTTPDYFELIGLRLEAGRWLNDTDLAVAEEGNHSSVLVNRAFARQFFPHQNPLGRRLLDSDHKHPSEIVGVVSDYRAMGVENGTRATIFWPDLRMTAGTLVLRSRLTAGALAGPVRNMVWSLDRNLPAAEVLPMEHYVDEWLSQRRFNTFLLMVFAGLALVLGMLGIYGVLAGLVASRVREIGIRMAIGATPAQIGGMVVRQSMAPVAIGVVAGAAASLVLGQFLDALLFHVRPHDPLTLAAAMAAILLAAQAAIWVPLRRATRVECTTALRTM